MPDIKKVIQKEFRGYDGGWDWFFICASTLIVILMGALFCLILGLIIWGCLAAPYHWPVIPVVVIPYVTIKFWTWALKDDN